MWSHFGGPALQYLGISPHPARQGEISSSCCTCEDDGVGGTGRWRRSNFRVLYGTVFHRTVLAGRSRRRCSSVACLCRLVGLLALGVIEGQDRDWTPGEW